jgi:two-component SAPR family response regulator
LRRRSPTRIERILESGVKVDLLFTDVVMPGAISGRQLAERAVERVPTLRILFTSGYTENAIVHNGRLDPGVELLSKPYGRQQLAAKVRPVLYGSPKEPRRSAEIRRLPVKASGTNCKRSAE